eukprot:scaffold57735_cov20-Prasinocladus_malaysianus.AAC.1
MVRFLYPYSDSCTSLLRVPIVATNINRNTRDKMASRSRYLYEYEYIDRQQSSQYPRTSTSASRSVIGLPAPFP